MKILLIGGFGYIGSKLVESLLKKTRHHITILDRLDYHLNHQFLHDTLRNPSISFTKGDFRHIEVVHPLIRHNDVVVNLAALVGEPLCAQKPEEAYITNQIMAQFVGEICRNENKKLIMMSTCSNYGRAEKPVNEDGDILPVSIYALTKVAAEKHLIKNVPQATVLRCATAYGLSIGRMRFDLLLNEFVRDAWTKKEIEVYGPQTNRPICHVEDIGTAITKCIEAEKIPSRVYNVGSSEQNYSKKELADKVAKRLNAKVKIVPKEEKRDYIVDFTRISKELDFKPEYNLEQGVDEMAKALEDKVVSISSTNV